MSQENRPTRLDRLTIENFRAFDELRVEVPS